MNKRILIIRSQTGIKYSEIIAQKIRNLGAECYGVICWKELDSCLKQHGCTPGNTLLHYRAAGPNVTPKALEMEKKGYITINKACVLERTSDKFLSCEWALQHGIILPQTKKGTRNKIKEYIKKSGFREFIIKPINSINRGAYCFVSSLEDTEIDNKLSQIPGEEIIFQEFVEYIKIYRVIVIGNKALDRAVFYDEPDSNRWKVSVCMNPNMKLEKNPDPKLLSYAKHLANIFESEIAFVDVFETKNGYVLSEINTACNLKMHEEKSGYDISGDIAGYLISQINKK